jgi:hypothetical protein
MVLESYEGCVYSVRYCCPNLTRTVECRQRLVILSNIKLYKIFSAILGLLYVNGHDDMMIYLLTAIGLSAGGSTHLHTNNT